MEQYKNILITKTILNNDIKTHEYYDYCDLLHDSSFNYECPLCNKINNFEETYNCERCEKLVCENCVDCKNDTCGIKNCNYCRNGHCFNNQTFMYCTDCFINDNLNFYNTYKDTIITSDILNENKDNLDFYELESYELESYELKYKCPNCLITTNLNSTNMCDNCDNYICNDCSNTVINNDECLNYNCKYCREGRCRYSYNECVCNNCYNEYEYNGDNNDYVKMIIVKMIIVKKIMKKIMKML